MNKILIKAEEISKEFLNDNNNKLSVIRDFSISINKGEKIGILGPSGCGKSTLIKILSKIIEPSKGSIEWPDENIKIDILSQNDSLIEWLKVEDNIRLNNKNASISNLINLFKLNGFEKSYPNTLSSGMRKRVLLASSILQQPDLVFLDEAFSGLDLNLKLELIKDITTKGYLPETYVLVTHDIMESILLTNKVIVLADRPSHQKGVVLIEDSDINPYTYVNSHQYLEYYSSIYKMLIPQSNE